MSKHTPGPWEIYPDGDRKHILRAGTLEFISPSYTKADWIAELDPDGTGHDEDETEANARLIAAAPALLDACQAIANRLDYLSELWGQEGVTRSLMDQVKAALALAEKGGA